MKISIINPCDWCRFEQVKRDYRGKKIRFKAQDKWLVISVESKPVLHILNVPESCTCV